MNPFEAFADCAKSPRQIAYEARQRAKSERRSKDGAVVVDPQRARLSGASASKKREIERQDLSMSYRKFKAQQLRDLLAGPHGRNIVELRKFMRRLSINDAPALLNHIPTLTWIWTIDPERRFQVRSMVAAQIARIRLRAGFHPFDDAVEAFGEPPDASSTVLRMLN